MSEHMAIEAVKDELNNNPLPDVLRVLASLPVVPQPTEIANVERLRADYAGFRGLQDENEKLRAEIESLRGAPVVAPEPLYSVLDLSVSAPVVLETLPEIFLTECDSCGNVTDCMKRERDDGSIYLCGECR